MATTNATITATSNSSCCTDTIQASLNNCTYSDNTSITGNLLYVDSIPSNINWGTSIPSVGDVYWNQTDNTMYIYNNTEKDKEKDNKIMNNNFNFGTYDANNIRMSLYGTAVKSNDNKWVAYDKKSKKLIDVDVFNFNIDSSKIFYKIPKAIDEVVEGDTILHNGKVVFVESVREDSKFDVIDPSEGTFITILPLVSPFGYSYLTVIMSLLDCMPEASEDSPFGGLLPILLSGSNNSAGMMMAIMRNKNFDKLDPMLLMLAFGNQNNLGLYYMMTMMTKQNSQKEKAKTIREALKEKEEE